MALRAFFAAFAAAHLRSSWNASTCKGLPSGVPGNVDVRYIHLAKRQDREVHFSEAVQPKFEAFLRCGWTIAMQPGKTSHYDDGHRVAGFGAQQMVHGTNRAHWLQGVVNQLESHLDALRGVAATVSATGSKETGRYTLVLEDDAEFIGDENEEDDESARRLVPALVFLFARAAEWDAVKLSAAPEPGEAPADDGAFRLSPVLGQNSVAYLVSSAGRAALSEQMSAALRRYEAGGGFNPRKSDVDNILRYAGRTFALQPPLLRQMAGFSDIDEAFQNVTDKAAPSNRKLRKPRRVNHNTSANTTSNTTPDTFSNILRFYSNSSNVSVNESRVEDPRHHSVFGGHGFIDWLYR